MTEDRWYQVESYQQALISLKAGKRPIVCLPTGSGKTRVAQKIAAYYIAQGKRILFTAHRSELVNQAARSMPDIETCTIQSSGLARDFDLIIIDECHHATASSYKRLIKNNPKALRLGLTATPTRLDGKSLKGQFDEIIQVAKTSELIQQGHISGIRLFAPEILIQSGKYTRDDLNLANTDRFNELAVTEYLKIAKGLKGVVFCTDRAHAHAVAASYRKSGIRAVSIDGATHSNVRENIDRRWTADEIDVICNCELYTEGVDLCDVDFVQILRPTDSLVMYFQMIGRGMRQGGEMLLLDHTDNWQNHGLPSDDYVFTLHPEDGKTCASTSRKRTQLKRGEDGEVFDTGRPIVNYKLVEVEKLRVKKHEFFRMLMEEHAINVKKHPNVNNFPPGLRQGTISEMSRRFNVAKHIVKRWNEECKETHKASRIKNLEKAMLKIQSQSSTPSEMIADLYGLSTADVERLKQDHRRDQEKIKKSKAPDIAEALVAEGILMSFNICKISGLHPCKFRHLYPEYKGSQYEPTKEYVTKLTEKRYSIAQICKLADIPQSQFRRWFPKY